MLLRSDEDSEFNELFVEHEGKVEDALFEYCFKHNIFYDNDINIYQHLPHLRRGYVCISVIQYHIFIFP